MGLAWKPGMGAAQPVGVSWLTTRQLLSTWLGRTSSAGRWTQARKKAIIASRVNAGLAVSQAVEQAESKPAVVVQSSAVGYYGVQDHTLISEEHAPGLDFLSQVCQSWEASTLTVEKLGVRRAIIRTGVVLSKDGGALPKMLLPFYFFCRRTDWKWPTRLLLDPSSR